MVAAFAAIVLNTDGTDWTWVAFAVVAGAAVTLAAWRLPWPALPRVALLALPVGCDLVIALLRQAQGGSSSGYAPLAILPVVFVALALGRRHVVAVTALSAAMLAIPILVAGAPVYPSTGWRAVALWTLVALIVGGGAQRGMETQRRQSSQNLARARELDGLVATQTLIATASFDLETVMRTVVTQARRLTGADAAVVELPDGAQLVYRAVAGSAEPFLGLRLDQAGAMSGEALRSGTILRCADSELEPGVDRAACRAVGARSMIVVPLLHEGRATGVLKIYSAAPHAFAERHAQLLSALGNLIGHALVRAELLGLLRDRADTDQLTGLPNRRFWEEQLDGALARSRRHATPVSVILLDLDDFKRVNDTQGHAAGDRLLRAVTSAWIAVARETDVLGRLGGDEFAVILDHADAVSAGAVAVRLLDALPDGQRCSVGIAAFDGTEDGATLLARADQAMYRHKRAGKRAAAAVTLVA